MCSTFAQKGQSDRSHGGKKRTGISFSKSLETASQRSSLERACLCTLRHSWFCIRASSWHRILAASLQRKRVALIPHQEAAHHQRASHHYSVVFKTSFNIWFWKNPKKKCFRQEKLNRLALPKNPKKICSRCHQQEKFSNLDLPKSTTVLSEPVE